MDDQVTLTEPSDDLFGGGDLVQKMMFTLVDTVIEQEHPSIEILHRTVQEEFGQRATPELVEYFKKKLKEKEASDTNLKKSVGKAALELVKTIASGSNPSVDKLKAAFKKQLKKRPNKALIDFFHSELQKKSISQAGVKVADGQDKVSLLRQVVQQEGASMEMLNKAFNKHFGFNAPKEMEALFNIELQKVEAEKQGLTLAQYLVKQAQKKMKKP